MKNLRNRLFWWATEGVYDEGLMDGVTIGKRIAQSDVIESAAKHISHLWGKPGADPTHVLSGIIGDIYPELSSAKRRAMIFALLKGKKDE